MERLQKIIAARGVASRRKAEELIKAGLVSVNDVTASLGDSADPDYDTIRVEGKLLPSQTGHLYIMLYKPRGYVTTLSDEKGRPNAAQLVSDCGTRVYPVGRLDMDSEGLLLFTNDGDFANRIMHPRQAVDKKYEVWTRGYREGAENRLRMPIVLDGYRIKPPEVVLLEKNGDKAHFLITIHEGRNRQIRRMCEKSAMTVTRLKRIQEGALSLGELLPGKWRYLTESEMKEL